MTDTVQVALIVSVAPTMAAGGALWISYKNNKRLKKVDETTASTDIRAATIETKVDGSHTELLNALLKITASANFIAGGQAEKDKIKES